MAGKRGSAHMNRASYIVTLECKHTLTFSFSPPKRGEELFCFRCMKYRKVEDAPAEFKIRCKNCRYSRHLGRARLTAETRAAEHASRKGHTVQVWDGRTLIYTFGARAVEQLPLPDDPPPF
jgi:hypothetical protein